MQPRKLDFDHLNNNDINQLNETLQQVAKLGYCCLNSKHLNSVPKDNRIQWTYNSDNGALVYKSIKPKFAFKL
jgi:hypothetical protein